MERQAMQIAEYLAGLTTEMIRMARDAELDTLAYLLSVAHLEAWQVQGPRAAAESGDKWLIPAKALLREQDDGSFDELIVSDDAGECVAHAEMMSADTMWIGIYAPGTRDRQIAMRIRAAGKLLIAVEAADVGSRSLLASRIG